MALYILLLEDFVGWQKLGFDEHQINTWVCYWVRGRLLGLCVWVDISTLPILKLHLNAPNTALYRGWYSTSARVGALRLPVLNCPAAHATNCFTTGERRDIFTRIIINVSFREILTFLDLWDHIIPGPIDQRSGNQEYANYLAFSSLQLFVAGLTYWSSDLCNRNTKCWYW